MLKDLAVLLLFIIISFYLFYPLLINITKMVPGNLGDPLLAIWAIGWNINSFFNKNFINIYDANILYPYKKSLTFSENFFAPSLIGLPIFLISKNFVITYNILFILSFILTAFCAYLLIKEVASSRFVAIIGGFIFSFNPWRFGHAPRLQILIAWWLPLCFLFLIKYHKEKKIKFLIYFSLSFIFNGLSNAYYMLFLTILLIIFEVSFLLLSGENFLKFIKNNFPLKNCIILFCLIVPILFLVYYPYYLNSKKIGFERGIFEAEKYSLTLMDYFRFSKSNLPLYSFLKYRISFYNESEYNSFIGYFQIIFILLGLIIIFRLKNSFEKNIILSIFIIGVCSFFFSLGPVLFQISDKKFWGPFMIVKIFPGGKFIRAPSRFVIFVYLAAAIIVCYSINYLWKNLNYYKKALLIILIALLIFEKNPMKLRFVDLPYEGRCPDVYKWLVKQKRGPIMELPLTKGIRNIFLEPKYDYFSTCHWFPLFNGYSGFVPRLQRLARKATINGELKIAGIIGIKYIIIHKDLSFPEYVKRIDVKAKKFGFRKAYEDIKATAYVKK